MSDKGTEREFAPSPDRDENQAADQQGQAGRQTRQTARSSTQAARDTDRATRRAVEQIMEALRESQRTRPAYLGDWAEATRTYWSVWMGLQINALSGVFAVQDAGARAMREWLDTAANANRGYFDRLAESLSLSQQATIRVADAARQVMEAMLPQPRR